MIWPYHDDGLLVFLGGSQEIRDGELQTEGGLGSEPIFMVNIYISNEPYDDLKNEFILDECIHGLYHITTHLILTWGNLEENELVINISSTHGNFRVGGWGTV